MRKKKQNQQHNYKTSGLKSIQANLVRNIDLRNIDQDSYSPIFEQPHQIEKKFQCIAGKRWFYNMYIQKDKAGKQTKLCNFKTCSLSEC